MWKVSRGMLCLVLAVYARTAYAAWDVVPNVDLSAVSTDSFTDNELYSRRFVDTDLDTTTHDLPFLLKYFKQLADSVNENSFVSNGKTISPGFIGLDVWRATPGDYYNARSQENFASIAYFYTQNASWNPYYNNKAVQQRLEAILNRWVSSTDIDPNAYTNSSGQFAEGAFPNAQSYNLAATAFGAKFMAQTLAYLSRPGVNLSPGLLDKVATKTRLALTYCLGNNSYYGTSLKNQYQNVFCGSLEYLALHPEDTALQTSFMSRYNTSATDFQSPAGYPREAGASDFSYNLGTHVYNQQVINTYAHGATGGYLKTVLDLSTAEESKFYDWISYNAVPLPDGSGFVLNAGIAGRKLLSIYKTAPNSFAETVPLIRAFVPTVEELATAAALRRSRPASAVDSLAVGDFYGYTPYDVTQRDWYSWNPTNAQRVAARATLPYLASDHFTEQRVDGGISTFVRRPGYYAAFNAGTQARTQQRFGLGLLWHPTLGSLMQTFPNTDALSWGTRLTTGGLTENGSISATFALDGATITPATGAKRLGTTGNEDLLISYNLKSGQGTKTVLFTAMAISVSVSLNNPSTTSTTLTEQFPLLMLPSDTLVKTLSSSTHVTYELRRDSKAFLMDFIGKNLSSTEVASTADWAAPYYSYDLLSITSQGSLNYTLSVVPEPSGLFALGAVGTLLHRRRKRSDIRQFHSSL